MLQLHWLPVRWRVQFKRCCIALCTQFSTGRVRRIWSTSSSLPVPVIHVPASVPRRRPTTAYHGCTQSWLNVGLRSHMQGILHGSWNGLPEDLRSLADPVEFQKELKTHFFTTAHNVYWHMSSWILRFMFCDCCNAPMSMFVIVALEMHICRWWWRLGLGLARSFLLFTHTRLFLRRQLDYGFQKCQRTFQSVRPTDIIQLFLVWG